MEAHKLRHYFILILLQNYKQLDHGDMSSTARQVSLRQFNHQIEVRVMLLSLKAGGVGLNLQRANHMVILDRWQVFFLLFFHFFLIFEPKIITKSLLN